MDTVDCVVVGAGVVGLAAARALALAGRAVVVLERHMRIGEETSSRNSEVIHAGVYYPTGSLKARACVRGKRLLYDYCRTHGVPHRRCGKLIAATSEAQFETMETLRLKAADNDVGDLEWLGRDRTRALEPDLACVGALLSPSTGIIDSHAFMLALQGEAEANGAVIAFASPLVRAHVETSRIALEIGGVEPMRLACRTLVNCGGLHAPALAGRIDGLSAQFRPRAYFCKGNYFTLAGRAPFSHLIYPAPEQAGLGVHLTLDLAGQARFGPDVEWLDAVAPEGVDYAVDPARAERFAVAVRAYWPALPEGALQPGYSGVRPKLGPAGAPAADFAVQGPATHGAPGLVNLFGIESPGLTAALALAEDLVEIADGG